MRASAQDELRSGPVKVGNTLGCHAARIGKPRPLAEGPPAAGRGRPGVQVVANVSEGNIYTGTTAVHVSTRYSNHPE